MKQSTKRPNPTTLIVGILFLIAAPVYFFSLNLSPTEPQQTPQDLTVKYELTVATESLQDTLDAVKEQVTELQQLTGAK